MAGLGCGSFGLSKNVKDNKSYIHVKLTDSAFKAIEEYIKSRDKSIGSPSVFFRGNDGELSIPNRGSGNTKFDFTLQEADQQGSYESIKQFGVRDLESLGPMVAKMKIAAKQTDSFQMTRDRMAADQEKNNKKRAKELKPINTNNAFGRHRSNPVTVTGNRKSLPAKAPIPAKEQLSSSLSSSNTPSLDFKDYKSSYSRTSHSSTNNNNNNNSSTQSSPSHRTHAGGESIGNTNLPGRPPPPPRSPKQQNPELIRRPLRERLIQLLAVRNYKKLEIHTRISKEGCKEKDKRTIMACLMSVSTQITHSYQLRTNFWGEVKEDWPFYTDEEKAIVRRNKAQHVSPSTGGDKGQSPSCTIPPSPTREPSPREPSSREPSSRDSSQTSRDSSQTTRESRISSAKRPYEATNGVDPTVKKRRGQERPPDKETKPDSYLSSHNRSESRGGSNAVVNGRHSHSNSHRGNTDDLNSRQNGKVSPNIKSLHTTKTSPIPPSHNDSPRHKNGYHIPSSGKQSPINGMSKSHHINGYNKNHKRYNGHLAVPDTSTTPGSSPDSHMDGEEPDYLRDYTTIMTPKQRSQYKADFNRDYKTYLDLYEFMESYTKKFGELDHTLQNEERGSEEYNRIKQEIIREYNVSQEDKNFQNNKKEYSYLHKKLMHIKQLVTEYDNSPAS